MTDSPITREAFLARVREEHRLWLEDHATEGWSAERAAQFGPDYSVMHADIDGDDGAMFARLKPLMERLLGGMLPGHSGPDQTRHDKGGAGG